VQDLERNLGTVRTHVESLSHSKAGKVGNLKTDTILEDVELQNDLSPNLSEVEQSDVVALELEMARFSAWMEMTDERLQSLEGLPSVIAENRSEMDTINKKITELSTLMHQDRLRYAEHSIKLIETCLETVEVRSGSSTAEGNVDTNTLVDSTSTKSLRTSAAVGVNLAQQPQSTVSPTKASWSPTVTTTASPMSQGSASVSSPRTFSPSVVYSPRLASRHLWAAGSTPVCSTKSAGWAVVSPKSTILQTSATSM